MWHTSADTLVFAALLLVAYPVADYLVAKLLKAAVQPRLKFYAWTLASEWVLTIGALIILWRHRLPLSSVGESLGQRRLTIVLIIMAVVLLAVLAVYSRRQVRRLTPERLSKSLERASLIIPRSAAEQLAFIPVGITAGFCEEILYRGWLWRFFTGVTGHLWIAVLVSAVAFGLAHAYQGRTGIIGTGIAGLLFSIPVLATNSLIPSQVIHAGLDLVNGLLLSKPAAAREASQANS